MDIFGKEGCDWCKATKGENISWEPREEDGPLSHHFNAAQFERQNKDFRLSAGNRSIFKMRKCYYFQTVLKRCAILPQMLLFYIFERTNIFRKWTILSCCLVL